MIRRLFLAFVAVSFLLGSLGAGFLLRQSAVNRILAFLPAAQAEDDEDDDDDEDETDDHEEYSSHVSDTTTTSSSSSSKPKTKTILIPQAPITVTKWVSMTKTVLADGYGTDTDGDGLVDALDPHPTIPEQEFFTDSDGDGVPDSDDQYPGHDDFYAFPDNADANQNGILDAYESTSADTAE